MSYRIYTTPGFILESRNTGEANKFFLIFTKDLGLIGATAQGVRLLQSKLRSHLTAFSEINVSVVRGKELWRLTSVTAVRQLKDIDAHSSTHALLYVKVLSLLKRLLAGEEKNESLFTLVHDAFEFARNASLQGVDLGRFEEVLVIRILNNLGYVGVSKELAQFTEHISWNREVITAMEPVQGMARATINKAFKESHL